MLEEDIVTLSDENRRLSDDLKAVLDERRQLSSQVQEYVTEVQRVENVIAQKVHNLRDNWLCFFIYFFLIFLEELVFSTLGLSICLGHWFFASSKRTDFCQS